MHAMILEKAKSPLVWKSVADPKPGKGQLLLKVLACAVCRTDLHICDGELTEPKLPLIPGHEIVGRVIEVGEGASQFRPGDRVGVPWLGWTCGRCEYCLRNQENLCDHAKFTGYQIDGGFAEMTVADERFCFRIPDRFDDLHAAPLLCAGLIGFRTLRMAGDSRRVGIYGFGAAAHLVAQVARHQGRRVYAFTREGDHDAQQFARSMGAEWAGSSDSLPPEQLDSALIFAPVGSLVPLALKATRKGGTIVCGGIHMSDIPSITYDLIWGERCIRSVANLTREDGIEFLKLAGEIPVETTTQPFPLQAANEALDQLRRGELTGAAVLVP